MSTQTNPQRIRFRHHVGLPVAGLIATGATTTIATLRWWLLPLLLIPASVTWWAARSGTDADADGIVIRRFAANRRISWNRIRGVSATQQRVSAELTDATSVALPAVAPKSIPGLLAFAGPTHD